jgi:hypothetical protein
MLGNKNFYFYFLQLVIILNDEAIGLENFNSNLWHGKHIFSKKLAIPKKLISAYR